MFHVNLPASIFARSRTSSISLVSLSPSLTTTSRFSMTCAWLAHLAVFFGYQGEQPLFKAAANDFCKSQDRGERGAQFMAYRGKERTLRRVGFFRRRSGLARIFKELGVMEGDAHRRRDCREQTLIGFCEAAFLVGGLNAYNADGLRRPMEWARRGTMRFAGQSAQFPSLARLRSISSLISRGWPVRMICEVRPAPKGRGWLPLHKL